MGLLLLRTHAGSMMSMMKCFDALFNGIKIIRKTVLIKICHAKTNQLRVISFLDVRIKTTTDVTQMGKLIHFIFPLLADCLKILHWFDLVKIL